MTKINMKWLECRPRARYCIKSFSAITYLSLTTTLRVILFPLQVWEDWGSKRLCDFPVNWWPVPAPAPDRIPPHALLCSSPPLLSLSSPPSLPLCHPLFSTRKHLGALTLQQGSTVKGDHLCLTHRARSDPAADHSSENALGRKLVCQANLAQLAWRLHVCQRLTQIPEHLK